MKKILLIILLFISVSICRAQIVSPAPSTCPQSPCFQATWTDDSATTATPGTAIMAVCIGSTTACGTSPASPGTGPNAWLEYSVPESTNAGTGIIPSLGYGNLINIAVNFTFSSGGPPSAWSAPFQFQIGQAPAPLAPSGVGGKQI